MNKKELAPVVLFTYKRPYHTYQVLEALKNNDLAAETHLIIYCDGPKDPSSLEEAKLISTVHSTVDKCNWPGKITIYKSQTNLGLGNSIIKGVTEVVEDFGKIIVLEDDLVTSKYFLKFMNDALNAYEEEDEVISIGALNFFYKIDTDQETFLATIPDCWGWATWKSSWTLFNPDAKALLQELKKSDRQNDFDFNGAHEFSRLLKKQSEGQVDSWAIRWQASAFLHDKKTVYPVNSVTRNIGFDTSGTHTNEDDTVFKNTSFPDKPISVDTNLKYNENSFEAIKSFYNDLKNTKENTSTKIKSVVKNLLRAKKDSFNEDKLYWRGDYNTWRDAMQDSSGYEQIEIIEKVEYATKQVLNKNAAFERDAVTFDKLSLEWPLTSCILHAAHVLNSSLNVLDFGGSLGSTYLQNRIFFDAIRQLSWNIVEQPHFVKSGKQLYPNNEIRFFEKAEDIPEQVDLILLSGTLQYLENPYHVLEQLIGLKSKYILLNNLTVNITQKDILTVQNVPDSIYSAKYPCWFFRDINIINTLIGHYDLIMDYPCYEELKIDLDGAMGKYSGYFFKLRE